MNTAVENTTTKSNRSALIALIILFALPPIAAWIYFLNPQLLPQSTSNHGDLIQPMRPVGELALITRNGNPFDWNILEGKWTLALVTNSSCGASCLEKLYQTGQIRKAVGAERQRVERILVFTEPHQNWEQSVSNEQLDGALLTAAMNGGSAPAADYFATQGTPVGSNLYIIDPNGYLMMHYRSDMPSKSILKDLEKLLKASQDWARGGQYGHR